VIVTAAQLAHLAELAAFAADYFACTNPGAARTFGDTALQADALSAVLRREESDARYGTVTLAPRRESAEVDYP
jgi:hypothetical protein